MCVLFFNDINYVFPIITRGIQKIPLRNQRNLRNKTLCSICSHSVDYEDCRLLEYVYSLVDRFQHFTGYDYYKCMFKSITKT